MDEVTDIESVGVKPVVDLDAVAPKKQVSTKNKKKASQATGLIADATDGGPRPKADVLPEGKVKGTVGSAGKANVAAGNNAAKGVVAENTKKWNISETVKAGSTDGISKNQKKVQSQKASSILLEGIVEKPNKEISLNTQDNLLKVTNDTEVRFRIGKTVEPMEKTYEMALDPELYINEVAKKYGINLKGSGQKITPIYNPQLTSAGRTKKATQR